MNHIHIIPKSFSDFFCFLDNHLDLRNKMLVLMFILGLLMCFHKKNATNIAALYKGKHKSSFTRMLGRKNIADYHFLELSVQKVMLELDIKSGDTIYLIIDSTYKNKRGKKLHNLKKFKTDKKYIWGHCFVFGIIYYKGNRIPVAVKSYKSKKYCEKTHEKFYTQVDLATQIINDFVPQKGVKVITLFDSFFSAKKVIDKVNNKGFDYVTVLAKNRVIENQEDMNISKRIEQLIQNDDLKEESFTHKGRKKTYFMHREVLTISKCGNVVVIFSAFVQK